MNQIMKISTPHEKTFAIGRVELTEQMIVAICDAIVRGATLNSTLAMLGIRKGVFARWTQVGESLLQQLDDMEDDEVTTIDVNDDQRMCCDLVFRIGQTLAMAEFQPTQTLYNVATGGSKDAWKAAITFLERRNTKDWGRKDEKHVVTETKMHTSVAEALDKYSHIIEKMATSKVT